MVAAGIVLLLLVVVVLRVLVYVLKKVFEAAFTEFGDDA